MRIDRFPAGPVWAPPSKSLSHRALIAGALAGNSRVTRVLESEDTAATLRCIEALGGGVTRLPDGVQCTGRLRGGKDAVLDCGESGSTLRFFLPIAVALAGDARFVGRGRLLDRPLAPYAQALPALSFAREGDTLCVHGRLRGGRIALPGDVSSQFITGLLLALPLLDEDSELTLTTPLQSRAYVDLTIDVLRRFGITIHTDRYERFFIPGGQTYRPADYQVEGDFSGAAFFLVAGALGRPVECCGLNPQSRQGDRAILSVLREAGATVSTGPHGGLLVQADDLRGVTVDVGDCPDLVPPVAALLCYCRGESRIVNAARLRLKESDRLRAVTAELNRLGARVTEGADSLRIEGVDRLHGGDCLAWNDHRIAMMTAVAAIRADGPVTIDTPDCVAKSYPGFWTDFCKEARV